MTHREVELLGVGAGPSNLGLAVALDELAPDDLARNSLLIEAEDSVAWQRGMLLPWAVSQVSFLKDLATLRNPRSKFSFLNYLHTIGRLDQFVNLGSFTPYRVEISGYLQWVADSLTKTAVEYRRRCVDIEPSYNAGGALTGWRTMLADGSSIDSRFLVLGAGRDPHIPDPFRRLPADRAVHSTRYAQWLAGIDRNLPLRLVVVGGAQSAAEIFTSVLEDLPESRPTMVMHSIGLTAYETSKFTNELYYPSFVDEFFRSQLGARQQMLAEMHKTNYSGLAPQLLDSLYRQLYLDRLSGRNRLNIITLADVIGAAFDGEDVVLELSDRKSGAVQELHCDAVLLGTGFDKAMPAVVRRLAAKLGLQRVEVSRDYRLLVDGTASCYLQGVNEATHGIADSLLSVLAHRSSDIVADILARRSGAVVDLGDSAVAASELSSAAAVPAIS
jgi:L-ornithine N5-monooxygenase